MAQKHFVFGCKGCGSAIAEAFFELGKIDFDRQEVDYDKESPERDRLLSYNPLCQVPTILLPDGEVLTETLAIVHYVDSLAPQAKLIPKSARENRTKFLRWSAFLVCAIYPTFTYGDNPAKWVGSEEAAKGLRASTDAHRMKLWSMVEEQAEQPYFLGENFSALDVYVAVMVHWRPLPDWFKNHCPKLHAIASKVAERSDLVQTWKSNFS
jgi:GST-like protein